MPNPEKIQSVLHTLIGPAQSFVCYGKGLSHMSRLERITCQNGEQKIADATTMAIFLMASVKIWIIGYQFMELKIAPAFLRYGFLLWLVTISCTLLFLFM